MRIRVITIGLSLTKEDVTSVDVISKRIKDHANILKELERVLCEEHGYEVAAKQICLNSFEHWLPSTDTLEYDEAQVNDIIDMLEEELNICGIDLCSIGGITSFDALDIVPSILKKSSKVHVGCSLDSSNKFLAEKAAETLFELSHGNDDSKVSGGERFSISFHCPPNTPFPGVAYHDNASPSTVTVGLECGDLLFLSFHGVTDFEKASENLTTSYSQMLAPINTILQEACAANGVQYGGIDPTMNSGGSLYDSVVLGMEQLAPYRFGAWGTLQIAAAIGQGLEQLTKSTEIKLCGLKGLILSPLNDIVMAQRVVEGFQVAEGVEFPVVTPPMAPALAPTQPPPSHFTLRDVISYCGVCGGGIDIAPVSGEELSVDSLSAMLLDMRALSSRSTKPLFCRLLVMDGLGNGDATEIADELTVPPIVDSRVFAV